MAKLTELEKERGPILEARDKNRAKAKPSVKIEDDCNSALCRLNLAIQSGLTTMKELEASEKEAKGKDSHPHKATTKAKIKPKTKEVKPEDLLG